MNNNNYKLGTVLECIVSKSPGYKKGKTYVVVDKNGVKGLEADDGFFDPISQLLSGFKVADATTSALKLLTFQKE